MAAVHTEAGGVEREGGEVAAECAESAAHTHETGCAVESGLRECEPVHGALCLCRETGQQQRCR